MTRFDNIANTATRLEHEGKIESLLLEAANEDIYKVNTLNDSGRVLMFEASFPEAKQYFNAAGQLAEKVGFKKGLADSLCNMGRIYEFEGDYVRSLEYQRKALKIREEILDREGVSYSLHYIGDIYYSQGNLANDFSSLVEYNDKALEQFFISLKIAEEIDDKKSAANSYNCIGNSYREQKKDDKAFEYYDKAIKIREETGDKQGFAITFNNIGKLYLNQKNYPKALEYFFKSLHIAEEIGDKRARVKVLGAIGNCYIKEKNYAKAVEYCNKSLNLAKEISFLEFITNANYSLSEIYESPDFEGHDALTALKYYKEYISGRDSINTQKLAQAEINFEFEKRAAEAKLEQDKKDAVAAAIKQKNEEILDSITYAKRLQDAILPPISLIKQYLPESFLFYKPKDIVAGDFYWMERSGENIIIAAADCTGHGVPGALVSVVCSNALNRTVKEFHITDTGKILDKVRELVLETFEKSEGNIQDGMDISMACINTKTNEIQWSGAYNSLWYIHNAEIIEVPADKQPIGKTDKPVPFNTHDLKLQKGDVLYLFTDGYADQFGGPKGKKFKYKQLEEKLLSIASLPMEKQSSELEETLEAWKGSLEQVDDILVIGIKV